MKGGTKSRALPAAVHAPVAATAVGATRLTVPAAPTPAREIELSEILRIANARVAVLPWVTGFEVAPVRDDADNRRYQAQIRAIPVDEGTGVEVRYQMPLADSRGSGFGDRAWDLLNSTHRFYSGCEFARLGARAQAAIRAALETDGSAPTPRLVAVGIAFDFAYNEPRVTADVEMLGHDLTAGVERVSGGEVELLARSVMRLVESHERRHRARELAVAADAVGWIDETASRLIEAAALDPREAIGLVQKEGWIAFPVVRQEGCTIQATLLQFDGVIEGWAMPCDRRWSLKHNELILNADGIPNIVRDALPGRRLGTVFQNPELPANAIICHVEDAACIDPDDPDDEEVDGLLSLRLDVPTAEIDAASGLPRLTRLP